MSRERFEQRAYAALCGLALGDSIGMPTEFLPPEDIQSFYGRVEDLKNPDPRHYHFRDMKRGMITDDTEVTLEVMDAIARNGGVSLPAAVDALETWVEKCDVFRKSYLGPTSKKALEAIQSGVDPIKAGRKGTTDGAAMRVVPIGILHKGAPDQAVHDAITLSLPTHGSNRALAGAAAIAAGVAEALTNNSTLESVLSAARVGAERGQTQGYNMGKCRLIENLDKFMTVSAEESDTGRFSGQIFDHIGYSLESDDIVPVVLTIFYRSAGDPMKAVLVSANLGGDTDTIGALAGALCGAFSGISHIDMGMVHEIEQINGLNFQERIDRFLSFQKQYRQSNTYKGPKNIMMEEVK